ncbi:TolC family protein [Polyangium spumosum]|nr:TolC family protein [Polyangium spumosum]
MMLVASDAIAGERGAASSRADVELSTTESFPSLQRAMELARERAPGVVSARGNVGVAQSSYAGARLAPVDNPYLEVFVDRGLQGVTKDAQIQANLWVPLELSGQRSRRIDEADALVAWQKTLFEATQLSAEGEAVRAYGAALVAAARVRTIEGLVADAAAEAELYQQRREAGDATLQEEKLASMEHARYEVVLAESRGDLTRALVELARATGRMFSPPDGSSAMPPIPGETYAGAGAARVAEASPHVTASTQEANFHARARERAAIEAHPPVNFIVSAGRGDFGEARFGGGVAWTFPVARRKQAEVARADAERTRALAEAEVKRRLVAQGLSGLALERAQVRRAREVIDTTALPAAQASADAAVAMKTAGKGEMLLVLTARRDLALLRLRRLELIAREWAIVGDIVALTGDLP